MQNDISSLSGGFAQQQEKPPRPCAEAQVMELRALAARYAAGCPFRPGDLVTPRKGYNTHGAGEPHIVVEVPPEPIRSWAVSEPTDVGSALFGERCDMRVACLGHSGEYMAFWGAAWRYEPYTGEGSDHG